MSRQEVMAWIDRIEQKYPVDEWTIDGLHIWPIVRIIVSFYYVEKANRAQVASRPVSSPVTFRQKINWLLTSVRFLYALRPVDFVFVGAFAQRVMHQGHWFNRFIDPVADELLGEGFSSDRMEYNDTLSDSTAPLYRQDTLIFLRGVIYPFQLLEKLIRTFRTNQHYLPQYQEFLCEVSKAPDAQELAQKLSYQRVRHFVQEVAYYRRFFRYYLKKARPRLLVGVCYYSYPLYGALAAAHEQSVPSVDLQHGPQSGIHVAYAGFSKVPTTGYNTLPKIFWVWDQFSKTNLRQWTDQQPFHRVKQWGHPWVRYWIKKGVRHSASDRPLVLYSLQPVGDLLEDFVLEAMSASVSTYQWHLRLHPRQQYAKSDLIALLKQAGLSEAVIVDDSLRQPLPEILARTAVHLTRFSGTALEAAMLDVPTLFLDPTAVHCFGDLLASEKAFYAEFTNGPQLLQAIERSRQHHQGSNYQSPTQLSYGQLLIKKA